MPTIDAAGPIRSCLGCRRRRPSAELVRVTWSAGRFEVDGPSDGRGAWLCRAPGTDRVDDACLDEAVRRRRFGRAWRRELSATEIERLCERLGRGPEPIGAADERTRNTPGDPRRVRE